MASRNHLAILVLTSMFASMVLSLVVVKQNPMILPEKLCQAQLLIAQALAKVLVEQAVVRRHTQAWQEPVLMDILIAFSQEHGLMDLRKVGACAKV